MSRRPSKTPSRRDYAVGKGKPPVSGQIKPGEVRNPWGRGGKNPRKEPSFDDILRETVPITLKGKRRRASYRELGYRRLAQQIAEGDLRSLKILMEHDRRQGEGETSPDPFAFDPELRKSILTRYRKEVRNGKPRSAKKARS